MGDEALARFEAVESRAAGVPLWRWPDAMYPATPELAALCALDVSARAAQAGALDLPRAAREQRRADPLLQHLDLVADGGLGHAQFLRGLGETAGFHHAHEHLHVGETVHIVGQ